MFDDTASESVGAEAGAEDDEVFVLQALQLSSKPQAAKSILCMNLFLREAIALFSKRQGNEWLLVYVAGYKTRKPSFHRETGAFFLVIVHSGTYTE